MLNLPFHFIRILAVDCQASDDQIHESVLTIHSSNHQPFNLY